jgi:hypothetical protein
VFEKSSDLKKSHTGDPTTFFKIQKKSVKFRKIQLKQVGGPGGTGKNKK